MITKSIKQKLKEFFLNNPSKKLRIREIEREVKIPLPSAIRYTKELIEENILITEKISNIKLFRANKTSEKYILEKKLHNLKQIHESGLINHLIQEHLNPTIILFGSFNKGEDTEESDIDLYIETQTKQEFKLDKFEKKLSKKIEIFNFSSIKKINNPELANNILNGTTLNGFIEIIK